MLLLKGRYKLLSQVGRGGMGVVYKAADLLLGNRLVAVKEMSQRGLTPQELSLSLEAFKREVLILAQLVHPNLPRIYDYFCENGNVYLVMDFIEGQTLARLLEQTNGKGLLVEEVLLIGEQLCNALNYLHTRRPQVIFRDMKPENVMISAEDDHIYLIDFGIARLFKTGQLKDTLMFGTVGYAPPEQFGEQTDERSDIYSLGVVFHQLLTGLAPQQKAIPFVFCPIRDRRSQVPCSLEELILCMVEVEPSRRPPTIIHVRRELQRIARELQGTLITQNTLPFSRSTDKTRIVTIAPVPVTLRGQLRVTYRQHGASVQSVAWSPDGTLLASCGHDKTVHIWEAATGTKLLVYNRHSTYVYRVAWSPNGTSLVSTSFGCLHVWNASTGELLVAYPGHSFWVYAVAWSQDGQYIVSGGAEGEIHIWEATSGKALSIYQGYPRPVKTLALSGTHQAMRLLSGCEDDTFYCWTIGAEENRQIYQGHKKEVCCIAWSPDMQKIASASRDCTVKVWDSSQATILTTYTGHNKDVLVLAWSPDGRYIASAGEDRTVRIWEPVRGETLFVYRCHLKEISSLAWSPNGVCIASASDDKTTCIWEISRDPS